MKKRIFAIALALSMSLGTVSAYAQTTTQTSVPMSQYATALGVLYNENYAYMIRTYSSDLTSFINATPVFDEYVTQEQIKTHITLVNAQISNLESVNDLITLKHVEPFYTIQPEINKMITAGKTYIDGCNKIYNRNPQGYYLISSSVSDIYDAEIKLSAHCDSIHESSMLYLSKAFPSY